MDKMIKITSKELNSYKVLNKVIEKEVIRIFNLFFSKNRFKYISFYIKKEEVIVIYHDFSSEYYSMINYFTFKLKYINNTNKQLNRAKDRGDIET